MLDTSRSQPDTGLLLTSCTVVVASHSPFLHHDMRKLDKSDQRSHFRSMYVLHNSHNATQNRTLQRSGSFCTRSTLVKSKRGTTFRTSSCECRQCTQGHRIMHMQIRGCPSKIHAPQCKSHAVLQPVLPKARNRCEQKRDPRELPVRTGLTSRH